MEKEIHSLAKAYDCLANNQFNLAEQLCEVILAENPNEAEALNILAFVYSKNNSADKAIQSLLQAIQLQPKNHTFHNNISNLFQKIGNFNQATFHLYEAIRISPDYAEAYNNLGNIYYKQNLNNKAVDLFEKAIRLNPSFLNAHLNLANTLAKDDRFDRAISHYITALKLAPNDNNIKQNLSLAYIEKELYAEAIPLLEEVIEQANKNNTLNELPKEIYIHLSESYLNEGKPQQAVDNYQKAIELNPNTDFLHHNLAVLMLRNENYLIALEHFQQAYTLNPNNATAKHMIAAIEQNSSATTSPRSYVKDLFDQYAGYYNRHVKEKLKYDVPNLLRKAAGKFISPTAKKLNVLDLGCGTGLCGVFFRDIATNLVGVDLSFNMLKLAKHLKAYDLLYQCDINTTIPGEGQQYFDYIIAADVFVYLGDLSGILAKCKSSLKDSGKFLFTIETFNSSKNTKKVSNAAENKSNNNKLDYILRKTGRFAHSINYIEDLVKNLDLKILISETATIRQNNNLPIEGQLFVIGNL